MKTEFEEFKNYVTTHYEYKYGWKLFFYVAEKILKEEDFQPKDTTEEKNIELSIVGDLIEKLARFNANAKVYISYDENYLTVQCFRKEIKEEIYNRVYHLVIRYIAVAISKQQAQLNVLGNSTTIEEIVDFMIKHNITE